MLSLIGPEAQTRRQLFDFIVEEMRLREHLAPHRIRPIRVALENQRDDLLAFAEDIDQQLAAIALEHKVSLEDVREVFEMGHISFARHLIDQGRSGRSGLEGARQSRRQHDAHDVLGILSTSLETVLERPGGRLGRSG